jgi:hypothetical protein
MASDPLPFAFRKLSQKELYGIVPVVCKLWNASAKQVYDLLRINLKGHNTMDDEPRQQAPRTDAQVQQKAEQVAAWLSKNGQYVQRLTIESEGIRLETLWLALAKHGTQLQLTKLALDVEDPFAAEGLRSALSLVGPVARYLTAIEVYSNSERILAPGGYAKLTALPLYAWEHNGNHGRGNCDGPGDHARLPSAFREQQVHFMQAQ